jgi:hypothetical protein
MGKIEDPQLMWGTETILLVEDNSSASEVTRLMLEGLGYSVIEAVAASRSTIKCLLYDRI